jgi:hypothetical protein
LQKAEARACRENQAKRQGEALRRVVIAKKKGNLDPWTSLSKFEVG